MKPFFITSTGTNIGKTYLTELIIKRCNELNINVNAIKPIISGFVLSKYKKSDTGIILKALNKNRNYINEISPWRFKAPISPDAASNLENKSINFLELVKFCEDKIYKFSQKDGYFIIEGVGGTMVPINEKETIFDLIKSLKIPVILVIGSYLGSISHTLNVVQNFTNNNIIISSIVISQSENNDVGENLTKSSLKKYIKKIPIYFISRTQNNEDNIVDKIIDL